MAKTQVLVEETDPIEAMKKELKKFPNDVGSYLRLGWAYYSNADYEKASETFSDGVDRFPEDVEIIYALALALKKSGEASKALANFRKVTLLAEKLEDRSKSGMLRRLAIGHANVLTEGDWNLAEETWESK
jgi:tetratricopeptide (TPR) repeat protein